MNENGSGFVNNEVASLVKRRGKEINDKIVNERDLENITYFGYKTLERSYLLKLDGERIVERPQYMWMRVALGIHCCTPSDGAKPFTKEEEDVNLKAAFETYDLMSRGYFTHASPTLFHSGTVHPQLSSCFLVQMSDDSINGIYDTLKRCAVISKVRHPKWRAFIINALNRLNLILMIFLRFYFKGCWRYWTMRTQNPGSWYLHQRHAGRIQRPSAHVTCL